MSRPRVVGTLVALGVVCAASALAAGAASRPTFLTPFDPQGGFRVQAMVGGLWQDVGDVACDRYVRERGLTLPAAALAAPRVRVRLVQHGGGAAQSDRVVLGETPPSAVAGATEPDAAALAAARDDDVLDAFGRTIEVTFPGGTGETFLRLAARVEPRVNEGDPFAFPPANQSLPMTPQSAFYRYTPARDGGTPAWPDRLDPAKALFAELCRPTTGHPDGVTYGWVANDRDTLFAEVEFTSDNTRDGDKDFASVTVARNGELKVFRVSESQTRWGRPSFVATERAAYHHKLYAFAIPFSEIGVRDAREAGELKLAFNAYGTSATFFLVPTSHDFGPLPVNTSSAPFLVTVVNNIGVQITLDTPYFTDNGPNSSQFQLTDVTCHSGLAIPSGSNCTFEVVFAPTVSGSAANTYTINVHTAAGLPLSAPFQALGEGIVPIPAVSTVGLALLALALSVVGYLFVRRR